MNHNTAPVQNLSVLEDYQRFETQNPELAINAYELGLKWGFEADYGRVREASHYYVEVYAIPQRDFSNLLQEATRVAA
jgi:hypothetical protein